MLVKSNPLVPSFPILSCQSKIRPLSPHQASAHQASAHAASCAGLGVSQLSDRLCGASQPLHTARAPAGLALAAGRVPNSCTPLTTDLPNQETLFYVSLSLQLCRTYTDTHSFAGYFPALLRGKDKLNHCERPFGI